MANNLAFWNPAFYANEALAVLQKHLGMFNTVYKGFDAERRAFGKGDTINIKRPSNFTVADAPIVTPQDLAPESVVMTLDKWREVKFQLTDKELAFTTEKMISDHIAPMAIALADDIDANLVTLTSLVPHAVGLTANAAYVSMSANSILNARKKLFDIKCPSQDTSKLWGMLNSQSELDLMSTAQFGIYTTGGPNATAIQNGGQLGNKYGFNLYPNQNKTAATALTSTQAAGTTFTCSVASAAGASAIGGATGGGSSAVLGLGSIISIAHAAPVGTREYVVTASVTASGTTYGAISISPPLAAALTTDTITVVQIVAAATANNSVFYHRDAFAIAMAPLSELGSELGARMFAVQDPITGAALRARMYYVGGSSKVEVAMDVLYGVKMINPEFACRVLQT